MYVNPHFAERELPLLHDTIEAVRFGVLEDDVATLLPHIVVFTLEIEAIQGKRKLSQNRAARDRDGVIRGLRERGADDDRAIAEAMAIYPYSSQEA